MEPLTEPPGEIVFPRLGTLSPCTEPVEPPGFMQVLVALAIAAPERLTCVVLPRIGDTALVLASLVALHRFRERFEELVSEYARTTFLKGDIVRINPTSYVYEFDGFFDRDRYGRKFFRLKVLNATDGAARSCDAEEILRLQRTDRRTPRGRTTTSLGELTLTALDRLLGIRALGNTAILQNEVLLQSNRASLEALLQNVHVAVPDTGTLGNSETAVPLGEVLPWGVICEDGTLRMESARDGTPLCAVSTHADRVLAAAEFLPVDSSLVVVDGARRIQNVETLLSTADRQRVLILAEHAEIDQIEMLRSRGVFVWQPDPDEIVPAGAPPRDRYGVSGELLRAATVASQLRYHPVPVADSVLDEVAAQLRLAEATIGEDTDASAKQVIGDCFGLLLELAEWYTPPSPEALDSCLGRLQDIADRVRLVAHYLPPTVHARVEQATDGLLSFICTHQTEPTPKIEALSRMLGELEGRGERSVILMRSAANARTLAAYVAERWHLPVVIAGRRVPPEATYGSVILAGWPRASLLDQVVGRFSAPSICLVGYEYERNWLQGYKRRRERISRHWAVEGEDRVRRLGLPPRAARPQALIGGGTTDDGVNDLLAALRLDGLRIGTRKGRSAGAVPEAEVREGRYVSFFGEGYAYLTRSHRVPRINALLSGDRRQRNAVEQVVVDELQPGDYVLFRASGDSDVISLIAEEMYGERYVRARRLAESWRPVLRSIAPDRETIFQRLRRHGLKQQAATVYGWLIDPSRIGPQDAEDLEVIANTARDMTLLEGYRAVYDAIVQVRGNHMAAGAKLTQLLLAELPSKLGQVSGEETEIDLTFGTAWIVQVEEVARDFEARSYMEVNRLLRDERHM